MPLLIPKRVLANIISHALEADPEESCGYLFGHDAGVEEARRMKNVHTDPIRRYQMYWKEQIRAQEEADARGREIVAIYHSHTHSQAYPSQTDIEIAAGWPEAYHVLISLVEKTRPIVRAYRISEDATVTEIPITTDGKPYIETTR